MRKLFHLPQNAKDINSNIGKTMKTFWQIDRKRLIYYLLAMFTQVITSIAGLYFAGQVLTGLANIIAGKGEPSVVWWALGFAIACQVTEQVAWRLLSYFQNTSLLYWGARLNPEFHRKRLELDIQRFEDPQYNILLNKVAADYNWKPANFAYQILNFIHAVTRALSALLVVISFAPLLIPLLILFSMPSLFIESRLSKVKWDIWGVKSDASRAYFKVTWLFDNKNNIMEFKLFGVGNYLVDYCRRMLDEFFGAQRKVLSKYVKPAVGARIGEGLLVGGVEFWLIKQVIDGKIAIGQYSFYSGVLQQFNNSVGLIFSTYGILYEYSLFMTDYYKVMETPSLLKPAENPDVLPKATIPTIELQNVSFAYPSAPDKNIFSDINLTIKPGEHIAIVGENGAGKSTLIKILLRLYDVQSGAILVDSHNLKNIDLDSWYRHVGVLFQDFAQYPFTISENIYMGRIHEQKDKAKIAKSSQLAGTEEMVREFKHGYETILDNSFAAGVEPSGGQWQRVALARAFYRDSNILILDEPTAAIDAKAEYEIFNNIFDHYKDKTTIIVSHRFSTVRRADRIIVIDQGKIVEQGTHKDLMNNKGLYHEMFSKQAEGYKD